MSCCHRSIKKITPTTTSQCNLTNNQEDFFKTFRLLFVFFFFCFLFASKQVQTLALWSEQHEDRNQLFISIGKLYVLAFIFRLRNKLKKLSTIHPDGQWISKIIYISHVAQEREKVYPHHKADVVIEDVC